MIATQVMRRLRPLLLAAPVVAVAWTLAAAQDAPNDAPNDAPTIATTTDDFVVEIAAERDRLKHSIAEMAAHDRRLVESIATTEGLPLNPLYAMFSRLDVARMDDPADADRQLRAGADTLKRILAVPAAPINLDPELDRLLRLADQAVAEGALAAATRVHDLAKAQVVGLANSAEASEDDPAAWPLAFAAVHARSAEASELTFDYLAAADDWAQARTVVERWDEDLAFSYATNEALALSRHGEFDSDNGSLRRAIELHRRTLSLLSPDEHPFRWAVTQNDLGLALATLGDREGGTERLEHALVAYRDALLALPRDRAPLNWARVQDNLGLALWRIGAREPLDARLEEAVATFRVALEERNRERDPRGWAATQNNLGVALWSLGTRHFGTQRLQQAAVAYRAALEERTRDKGPLDWATTQNNLGLALMAIGEEQPDAGTLHGAVDAFRAALQEWTRERTPLFWVTTQVNLGAALTALGQQETGTARLEEAVAVLGAALEEWDRKRVPVNWASIQTHLGWALGLLGQRTADIAMIRDGRDRLNLAWRVYKARGEDRDAFFLERVNILNRSVSELMRLE